jgi:hypothetical protein
MVAGYQRLNERKTQPNPNIVFIKPLEGPDKKIAQDFLERIAAQCRMYPYFRGWFAANSCLTKAPS